MIEALGEAREVETLRSKSKDVTVVALGEAREV